ncbi:hypothetical protein PHISCL_11174 [Aspergillus sclerotialis]|uniref:Uncharacterized protein n=1 Tax=Aspergillus sclerotialis TaxID=2070753 RepID=A0A3A2Z009_9EURO|nr:hypothetical protein PHISCL_11174 [Aspergillus sclerotialis]
MGRSVVIRGYLDDCLDKSANGEGESDAIVSAGSVLGSPSEKRRGTGANYSVKCRSVDESEVRRKGQR